MPEAAALLIAGAYGAVLSVIARLLSRGVLVANERGVPVVRGPLDEDAGDLDRAVVELVAASPGMPMHALYRRLRNHGAIMRLSSRLVAHGWLMTAHELKRLRRLLPVGLLIGLLGVARMVGVEMHVVDAKPPADNLGIGPFMLMCGISMYALSLVFVWPGATDRGKQVLGQLYERYPDPNDGVLSDGDLAYVAALHGPASISARYPELAPWVDDDISWHVQRR
jgi:uncharacterized protein (TIGR04222 family)